MLPIEPETRRTYTAETGFLPTREPERSITESRTDHAGRARIEALAIGWFRVTVEATGFALAEARALCVSEAPGTVVQVRLTAGHALRGTARLRDGSPVANVLVILAIGATDSGESHPAFHFRARTGPDGTWRVEGLPTGGYEVWTWRDGRGFQRQGHVAVSGVEVYDLALTNGGTLCGRVTDDTTGDGIAGVRVALWSDAWMEFSEPLGDALTASDGRYVVHTCQEHAAIEKIALSAVGYARKDVVDGAPVCIADGAMVERNFAIHRESRVEGRVLGPAGPIAGARVRLCETGSNPFHFLDERDVTTDEQGRYVLDGLAAGTIAVWAEAKGMLDPRASGASNWFGGQRTLESLAESARLTLAAEERRTLDLTLVAAADPDAVTIRISGIVLLPDGKPAAHADVWTSAYGAGEHRGAWLSEVTRTVAAADGTFSIEVTGEPGDFGVEAKAAGCDPVEQKFLGDHPTDQHGVVLRLSRIPWVHGRVRSSLGAGVAAARVRMGQKVQGRGGPYTNWNEPTPVASDGTYELLLWSNDSGARLLRMCGWGGTDDYVVLAELDGHAPAISTPFHSADAAQGLTLDLDIGTGVEIRGHVAAAATGRGVAAAQVLVTPKPPPGESAWPPRVGPWSWDDVRTLTDASGAYVVRGVVPGPYTVVIRADGFSFEQRDVDAATTTTADFALVPNLPIAGIVIGPDGEPVPGASVSLHERGQTCYLAGSPKESDARGAFRFDAVRQGAYAIDVWVVGDGPSLAPREVPVEAGETDLRVRLDPGQTISGRLLDADGAPVADGRSYAEPETPVPGDWPRAKTDASGRFTLRHVAQGTYHVSFPDLGLTFEHVRAGEAVELRFPGSASASFRLVDPSGQAVNVGTIGWFEARPVGGVPSKHDVVHLSGSSEDGMFRFEHLAHGRYEVRMSSELLALVEKEARDYWTLPPGTILEVGHDPGTLTAVSTRKR